MHDPDTRAGDFRGRGGRGEETKERGEHEGVGVKASICTRKYTAEKRGNATTKGDSSRGKKCERRRFSRNNLKHQRVGHDL